MKQQKEYDIIGSRGDVYKVTPPTDDKTEWTCTCPHFFHRKVECKHIKEIKTALGK